MRLRRFRIEKLFGLFTHEITLNDEPRITILHAPNGYGKTVILQMMAAILNVGIESNNVVVTDFHDIEVIISKDEGRRGTI